MEQEFNIIKTNKKLTNKINSWIQFDLKSIGMNEKSEPKDIQKYNLFYLIYDKKKKENSELKISKKAEFEKLGIGKYDNPGEESTEGLEQRIKRNKLAYLLFNTDMNAKLDRQGIIEIDFNDTLRLPLLFGSKVNDDEKYKDTDKIYNFNSIEKIYNVLLNIQYLDKNDITKVKSIKTDETNKTNDETNNKTNDKSNDKRTQTDIITDDENTSLFADIFNLDKLKKHVLAVGNLLLEKFAGEINNYKNIRNKHKDNINEFFIQNTQLADKSGLTDEHISGYFTFLKENFAANVVLDALPSAARFQKGKETKPFNTDKKRKSIVTNYAKYILDPDELEGNDEKNEEQLYNRLKADRTKLSNIITYHNLHKILETLYLSKGTILKVSLFELIDNKLQEPKQDDKNYIKVLRINPTKLDIDERRRAFDGNNIEAIFEIEFEKIYTYSTIKFHLNIIDINNPANLLENFLETEQTNFQTEKKTEIEEKETKIDGKKKLLENNNNQEEIKKLTEDIEILTEDIEILKKKEKDLSIIDINNTYSIYKVYSNKIFRNIKNPDNKIIIQSKFDYDKLTNNFNILKKTIERRFPDQKIDDLRDIFIDSKIFDFVFKETQFKHDTEKKDDDKDKYIKKIINEYYLNKFFFKINSNLNIDNKIAEIIDVQIRRTDNIKIKEQKNIKEYNSDITKNLFYKEPSKRTRLALDDVDNIYNVFLDVSVFFKNKITDKVPLSLRIKTVSSCIQRANTLDKIMYGYLHDLYPKNLLENKIRNKESSNLENKPEKVNAEIQKGGKNRVTKKNINKRRHNTLKNLVTYYAI